MPPRVLHLSDSVALVGAPEATPTEQTAMLRSLRSRWPTPTNAQALSILEALHQFDSFDEAVGAGWGTEPLVRAYFNPTGILPRMRLIAAGVANRGDKFKTPGDPWWSKPYRYAGSIFYNVLLKYATLWDDNAAPGIVVDEELASGDPGSISASLNRVIEVDYPAFRDSPCEPPYIIPVVPNTFPLANPACATRDTIKKPIDVVVDTRDKLTAIPWWVWVGAIYLLTRRSKQ